MIIIPTHPGEWLHFVKRKDNIDLNPIRVREKYRDEKMLFENYVTNLEQHRLMVSQQSSGGGPKKTPSTPFSGFAMRVAIPTPGFNFKINLTKEGGVAEYTIDWGDGTIEEGSGIPSHTYSTARTYTIHIIDSDMDQIQQQSGGVTEEMSKAITHILSWGDIQWLSTHQMFYVCNNLVSLPNNAPDLSNVTNMELMLAACNVFNQDISNWDTSNVTNMRYLFASATSFDQDISNWDTSNVTDMFGMFYNATVFNQPIGNWDVGNLVYVDGMFTLTSTFNQDLGNWNVESLYSATQMFYDTSMTTANYDNLLIGWANKSRLANAVFTNDLTYSAAAVTARTTIINTPWTVFDDGQV